MLDDIPEEIVVMHHTLNVLKCISAKLEYLLEEKKRECNSKNDKSST